MKTILDESTINIYVYIYYYLTYNVWLTITIWPSDHIDGMVPR